MKNVIVAIALVVLGRATGSQVIAADAPVDIAPVWRLDVAGDSLSPRANLVVNAFADAHRGRAFPLSDLPVRLHVDCSKVFDGRVSPCISIKVARLEVRPDGRLPTSSLSFVSADQVSVNEWTGRMTVLAPLNTDTSETATLPFDSAATFPVAMESTASEEFYRWEESPDRSWGLVHTSTGTSVFKRGTPRPWRHIRDRVYYGSFSRDGSRYFAVAETGELRRWVLLTSEGVLLSEGKPTRCSLSQLYLSPDGKVVTFESEGRGCERHGTVGVDLAAGREQVLPVKIWGTRYYSADGRTMLDLGAAPGRLQLYDTADPLNPVAVAGTLDAVDGHFITAAVSSDGSLIAVEMLEPEDNPHRNLMRVVVFDRRFRQRAVLLRRTTTGGLQFEGRFLFVGLQRHPIPTYFELSSTSRIILFDLSSL